MNIYNKLFLHAEGQTKAQLETWFDNGQDMVQTKLWVKNFLKKRSVDIFDSRAKHIQVFTITVTKHSLDEQSKRSVCHRKKIM